MSIQLSYNQSPVIQSNKKRAALICAGLALSASAGILAPGSAYAETSDTATSTITMDPNPNPYNQDDSSFFTHEDPAIGQPTKESGAAAGNTSQASSADSVGQRLPNTGFPMVPAALGGAVLIAAGSVLVASNQRRS